MLGVVMKRPPVRPSAPPAYHPAPSAPGGVMIVGKGVPCPVGTTPGGCSSYFCTCAPRRGMFGLGQMDTKTILLLVGGAAVLWYMMKK